ncbi:hypothetical protein [Acidisarcina polymorpha]|uniref:hypothetical protein n=1 Tax=Acidisarcina polymorpha TaxID=2211140 RepID=UPI001F37E9AA|nr:hypothetical protein [Acidisarcina polymorpha]
MNGLPVWQLLTVFSVPTFTVLLGILLGQRGNDRLERRMERIEDEQRALRKQMNEEYIGLLNMFGDHGQRIVRLEQRGSHSA